MFVTSEKYRPGVDFNSLEAADALCQGLADAAQLNGTYRAWLSTASVAAKDRLVTSEGAPARGWVRSDGKPFADNIAAITAGKIWHAPELDEHGVVARGIVATGTGAAGAASAHTADGWTSQSATFDFGLSSGTTSRWTSGGVSIASTGAVRLYCFGVDLASPLVLTPASGRRAFVTQAAYAPSGGVAGADALCAMEAQASQLAGVFRALISTTTEAASNRFSIGDPWVRLDGVVWAESLGAISAGDVATTLNVDSSGAYRSDRFAWGGAISPGEASRDASVSCQDWSTTSGGGVIVGEITDVARFFDTDTPGCNTANVAVYCLQE